MLGLPNKTLVAIEAVLDIAFNAAGSPVQSGDITQRQGIPRRSLEPVLQQLTRAGILTGVRGPRGGYRLARERRRITLGEIVRVISGKDEAMGTIADADGSELGLKVVRPLWGELGAEVMRRLDEVTLDELCWRAEQAGVESETRKTVDFTI